MYAKTLDIQMRHQCREREPGVGYGDSSGYARLHEQRRTGTGYGSSSGYAGTRRYAPSSPGGRFRIG